MAYHPKSTHERVLHRYKIVRGQLETMIRMLEENAYCMDVLHQSNAIQKALRQADAVLLEHHLHGCVVDAAKTGKAEEALGEVLDIFKKR